MATKATKVFAKNARGEDVEITNLINSASGGGVSDEPFTVNGVAYTPDANGEIKLLSNSIYVLKGTLNGKVVIGEPTDVLVDQPTLVILAGVNITTSAADNAAIEYAPESDKFIVDVAANSVNRIACTHSAAMADSQKGALHSGNQLILQGSGYLSIVNKGGHGVKASELRISGNPHVYVEAIHDGFHGNNIIAITGGVLAVNGANDGFGTRAAQDGKPAGKIWLFGGEYFAYGIKQMVFDSKAQGAIFVRDATKNTKDNVWNNEITGITLHTDVAATKQYGNIAPVEPSAYFGAASVTGCNDNGSTYTANTAKITISGYINKNFVLPITSAEVTLSNAFIDVNADAFFYSQTGKNVKITAAKDTVNIVRVHGGGACVKSNNNIAFEPKSFGFLVMITDGDTAVSGSEVIFRDGFGGVVVQKGTIIGSQVTFGEDGKAFGGGLNAETIEARLSSKGQKGNITATGFAHTGCVYAKMLKAAGSSTLVGGAGSVCYKDCQCATMIDKTGRTREPYEYIPYDSPITFV